MIAQIGLTVLLLWVIAYAWADHRRAPLIAMMAVFVAVAGLYFVWLPGHASWLAVFAGIGRGVDLIQYVWLVISLIMFLNLHLKLRSQTEVITALAREIAIINGLRQNSPVVE
jgi:hypothetical protein